MILPVLMLHGLYDRAPSYAQFSGGRTCLLPVEDFSSLIGWCCREFDVIRATDLDDVLSGTRSVRRPLLLTFDDGLASVIDLAVPVLRDHHVSALAFVTAEWTDSGRAPFVFRLERLLYDEPPLVLEAEIGQGRFRAKVESREHVPAAIGALWTWLFERRQAPLRLRADQVSVDGRPVADHALPDDRQFWVPASWSELRSAVAEGVLEPGSHMLSHRPLGWLDRHDLDHELDGSRVRLEQEFGRPVTCCSYPHGISSVTSREAAARHFTWAFANNGGPMVPGGSRHAAPRLHVPGERWEAIKPEILLSRVTWLGLGARAYRGARAAKRRLVGWGA
jgi:peptidoglycan/xylan/chitin deacetylase (PgdA/CDA1 family)